MKKFSCLLVALMLAVFLAGSANAIGIRLESTIGGTLEDALLIASVDGAPPRDVVILGDLDLAMSEIVIDAAVDAGATHWWLLGHQSTHVIYSSVLSLGGVDLYSVEPYDIPGAELAWNIPANIEGYASGGSYSFDWWAQTVNNHSSHVAGDGETAGLWMFSDGSGIGSIAINLYTNDIPGGGGQVVPIPAPFLLLGSGMLGLGVLRRKIRKK